MPTVKVIPEEIYKKLLETFSDIGYDGASMERLAAATGLKKASLYHRFPGGKKDMAMYVLKTIEAKIRNNVFILTTSEFSIHQRLDMALAAISALYNRGSFNCVLRMLSVGSEAILFKKTIANCFLMLVDGFNHIALESGHTPKDAKAKAIETVALIQGSLVLSGSLADAGMIFKNSLKKIPEIVIK